MGILRNPAVRRRKEGEEEGEGEGEGKGEGGAGEDIARVLSNLLGRSV